MGKEGWEEVYQNGSAVSDLTYCDEEHAWMVSGDYVCAWNGSGWDEMLGLENENNTDEHLYGIEALDPQHIWATTSGQRLGQDNDYEYFSGLYFYDGMGWSKQYEFEEYSVKLTVLDAGHIWAVSKDTLYFFDGKEWVEQLKAGDDLELFGAKSSTQVLAAVDENVKISLENEWGHATRSAWESRVFLYNDSCWRDLGRPECKISSLEIVDESHVWAAGSRSRFDETTFEEMTEGVVFFWDGSSWTEQLRTEKPTASLVAYSPDLAWAAGESGLWAYNGKDWTAEMEGVPVVSFGLADDQNAWLVSQEEGGPGRLMCFDGEQWSEVGDTALSYRDVYVLDASHVWATAGPAGSEQQGNANTVIRFFNGKSWTDQLTAPVRLDRLTIAGPGRVWAYSYYDLYTAVRKP